ncbi:bifunctional polysaccharide deacetylase/glycosyltransferase family 2 protein [Leifsonia sp. AG29]|uniref:bifunctional polysaccharide deacetylase/glycosyltransferase family 2 protein n=1 Tax=Leifsonia sp. AG29 TaxID=2598860 RepID=UPI00131DA3A1|nr:bifunctional polysaccharide deacetylase/glycosyltransferase family 2 protein [Leifsonia sp. AG29]
MSGRRASLRPQSARVHWVVLIGALIALAVALLVEGYTQHLAGIGDDAAVSSGSASAVPAAVTRGGPMIDARGATPATARPHARTIALTFDDGPDPRWTPEILRVLRRHGAHATFFMVGTAAIAHPDLVRAVVAAGDEVGVHTLTHVDLSTAPEWRRQLEMQTAQQAIVDATGRTTSLLRPPYSSGNDAVTDSLWSAIRSAGTDGYLTVLSTRDGQDWRRPGAAAIERAIVPRDGSGQVVLLHDGGGDRSQTVRALDAALTRLDAESYTVTTVGRAFGVEGTSQAASLPDRLAAAMTVWGIRLSDLLVGAITVALVLSGIVMLVRAILVLATAARHRRQTRGRHRPSAPARPEVVDPVTVIVPAYNEAAGIEAAVRSLVASTHPVEVIVVDDGSTDGTADIVEALGLPVVVIRQSNGGKPAALNAGLRAASHDIVVMVDGDTVFEPGTVHALIQPLADPAVGAVSGNTKIINRQGVLGAWQHIEYVVGFNLDRRLFDVAECMPTVPGAIGAFRRSALERVGGVSDDTLAEDTDLTMALCRDGWRVVYEDDARAWTEAPASLGALWRQRYRWCYGTIQAMWKHRGALVQGGQAGKLGRRGLVYLLILQVLLPLFAPVVDLFAVYGLVFLDPGRIAALWLAFLALQAGMAWYAFRIDKEPLRPLWTLPLQQVVYRQLMYLVVIQSVFTAFAGTHLRWHRMERYGTLSAPVTAETGS